MFLALAFAWALSCGSNSSTPDAGSTPDSGSTPDAGSTPDSGQPDAGPYSVCGHPGDQGNALGVGMYCQNLTDCAGNNNPDGGSAATICSAIANSAEPPNLQSYYCTYQCDPCSTDGGAFCGSNASCFCQDAGIGVAPQCGCAPNTCLANFADAGSLGCH